MRWRPVMMTAAIEPSRNMVPSEQTLLAKWLTMMNSSGIPYRVVLYSECNDKAFKTAADWFAYWSFYAPVDTTFGPMTMPWWNEYGSYLMHLINTGKITLGTINFAAKANGRTVDVINSATDPRIPMIKQMAQTVQAAARTAA